MTRKYEFSWELIGDIKLGRPNLGPLVRVEVYRLLKFTLRDTIEKNFGPEKTDEIFYGAGKTAGAVFYDQFFSGVKDFNELADSIQNVFRELKIGVFRFEESDMEEGTFMMSVGEDADCSGLPELDYETCVYDEGFIAAILEKFTGKPATAKEIDCWTTGGRTCRFLAKVDV